MSDFYFSSHFLMKFLRANRIAPDGTPRSAASHLGLCCLPMSHKDDSRLISVKGFQRSLESGFGIGLMRLTDHSLGTIPLSKQ